VISQDARCGLARLVERRVRGRRGDALARVLRER